jgi:hypothetical protein
MPWENLRVGRMGGEPGNRKRRDTIIVYVSSPGIRPEAVRDCLFDVRVYNGIIRLGNQFRSFFVVFLFF